MKKLYFICMMFLFCLMLNAQVKFGVKAGATFAWLEPSSANGIVSEYNTLAGFQGGVFAEIPLTNYFAFQPEILFSTEGAKAYLDESYPLPSSSGYSEYAVKLNATIVPLYIEFPMHLKINFTSMPSGKFSIGAGPLFAYGIGGKEKITGTINGSKIKAEVKLFTDSKPIIEGENGDKITSDATASNSFKRFNVGISLFASYEFNNRVLLFLGYQHGLKNISEDVDEDLQTRYLSVSLGYKF